MASILIKLDKRRANAEGKYPVKVILFNNQTNASISISLSLPESAWIKDGMQRPVKTNYPGSKVYNDQIEKSYLNIKKQLFELEESGAINTMKASDIKKHILSTKQSYGPGYTFFSFANEFTETCNTRRTRELYEWTLKAFNDFAKDEDIRFSDIDKLMLESFEKWLIRKGIKINTRAIHFRNIRALFNKAIANGYVSRDIYPFYLFKIKSETADNEFLSPDQFRMLYTFEFKTESQCMARDYWMLLFFMCGISPIDLYYLKNSTDKDGRTNFARIKVLYKTQNPVRITIQPEAQNIINKYKASEDSEYLLHFESKYTSYEIFKSFISKKLREIASITGLSGLTMYWARHTWATTADALDVNEKTISKALGHTDKSVAGKNYISFDWSKVDIANRKVIDYILNIENNNKK